jgi:hypothetical protein
MPVPDDTPSQARKLRVTIVGHASPRWRGAANDADADQRNERLARQRADQVFLIVERLLRNRLGQDVVIEKNVTIAAGNDQPDLVLTARGDGSREAREDEHKPRSSDDDYDRRVEVGIDLAVPREVKVGRSLPSEQAKTKEWSVTINRLRVVRAFAAGGGIEVVIRNRKTGKEVVATAKLYGTGGPRLNPFATEEETGTKRVWFNTTDEVAISEFEDTRIFVERWDVIVGIGERFLNVSFPELSRYGPRTTATMWHHFGVGIKPNGFLLWGRLHIWNDTDDWVDQEETVVDSTLKRRSSEGLLIVFPTASAQVPSADLLRLDEFVTTWCRRLTASSP